MFSIPIVFALGLGIGACFACMTAHFAWQNGVIDGYGACEEPWNPGYRRALAYLRGSSSAMRRWPRLNDKEDEDRAVEASRMRALILKHGIDAAIRIKAQERLFE